MARWSLERRPFLVVAAGGAVPAPVAVPAAGPEYFVPSDPMDELQCDSCQ
jgi:hypothetical protein